jgi:hypothetical protein
MTPSPHTCPLPPDCGLFDQRLAYTRDEPLRRAVLRERRRPNAIASMVWADLNCRRERAEATRPSPTRPTLPPPPEPVVRPDLFHSQKGARK